MEMVCMCGDGGGKNRSKMLSSIQGSQQIMPKKEKSRSSSTKVWLRDMEVKNKIGERGEISCLCRGENEWQGHTELLFLNTNI